MGITALLSGFVKFSLCCTARSRTSAGSGVSGLSSPKAPTAAACRPTRARQEALWFRCSAAGGRVVATLSLAATPIQRLMDSNFKLVQTLRRSWDPLYGNMGRRGDGGAEGKERGGGEAGHRAPARCHTARSPPARDACPRPQGSAVRASVTSAGPSMMSLPSPCRKTTSAWGVDHGHLLDPTSWRLRSDPSGRISWEAACILGISPLENKIPIEDS